MKQEPTTIVLGTLLKGYFLPLHLLQALLVMIAGTERPEVSLIQILAVRLFLLVMQAETVVV
jgi:hypothetical protein